MLGQESSGKNRFGQVRPGYRCKERLEHLSQVIIGYCKFGKVRLV